jgi:hypothetical protein
MYSPLNLRLGQPGARVTRQKYMTLRIANTNKAAGNKALGVWYMQPNEVS